ncbi:hypothetical protein H109_01210 [Trichophyton interdigitale MR816]|uniref:Uncharacterized protein n=1 Tax=Trichophyton interdigitale (strain MR816) TaxID=1215338 RepID=A0A059JGT7_TRIIM|nr:hypothetical protein H109_01210 [Trichophyton interdigitale MR816]
MEGVSFLAKPVQRQPTAANSAGNRPSGGLGADRGGKAGLQRLAGLLDVGLPSNARALWTVQIYSLEHEASATNGYSKPEAGKIARRFRPTTQPDG